jgi:hypothetical protein
VERVAIDELEENRLAACLHGFGGPFEYTSNAVDRNRLSVYKYAF